MRASRGDSLLHPVVLVAVVVLVLNDHWWKGVGPALVTGRLSDVAGLLFFPLLLQDGFPTTGPRPVALVADPTDLFTLTALTVAWWLGQRRIRRARPVVPTGRRHDDAPASAEAS